MRAAPPLVLVVVLAGWASRADPVGPADYPELGRLLREPVPPGDVPRPGFAALYREPQRYRGTAVRVGGAARRTFRQPALGAFPALVEVWLADAAGNPIGLMFPDPGGTAYDGRPLAFTGRFFGLVDYPDGKDVRRGPLIVGPGPPTMEAGEPPGSRPGAGREEWLVAAAAAAFVLLVLGAQHVRRPRSRPRPNRPGPRPEFEPPGSPADG
jgi:hypothetical protein